MEAEKKKSGGGGVGAVALEDQGGRKRFFVELKPGETTIVSWKKLLGDDPDNRGNSDPTYPPSPPSEEGESNLEEKLRREISNVYVNGKKKKHNIESSKSANKQETKRRTNIPTIPVMVDDVHLRTKHKKMGHARAKVSFKNEPFMESNSIQFQGLETSGKNSYEAKLQRQLPASVSSSPTRLSNLDSKFGSSPYTKAFNEDVSRSLEGSTVIDKIEVTTHLRDHGNDAQVLNDIPDLSYARYGGAACVNSTYARDSNEEEIPVNISHKDNGKIELPDLNLPYTAQAVKTGPNIKDTTGIEVAGTLLERAILELERMAAESRALHIDVQDADHSPATKRRLPRELKQTLAKVARLAQSNNGNISDELISRLMNILGRWVQLRTLKRYLREMVPEGLLLIREENVRFRQIEQELIEMIQRQAPSLEAKDQTSNDTCDWSGSKVVHEGRHTMDYKMEDKICDLYDIYVQGMDEIKSPEIRKFYVQLAGLWPEGGMDNHGIRDAICRSKERRKMLFQAEDHEKCKKKKSSIARTDEVIHEGIISFAPAQCAAERLVNATPSMTVLASSNSFIYSMPELDQNLCAQAKRSFQPSTGSCDDNLRPGLFTFTEASSMKQIEPSVGQGEIRSDDKRFYLEKERGSYKPLKHESVEHLHKSNP